MRLLLLLQFWGIQCGVLLWVGIARHLGVRHRIFVDRVIDALYILIKSDFGYRGRPPLTFARFVAAHAAWRGLFWLSIHCTAVRLLLDHFFLGKVDYCPFFERWVAYLNDYGLVFGDYDKELLVLWEEHLLNGQRRLHHLLLIFIHNYIFFLWNNISFDTEDR